MNRTAVAALAFFALCTAARADCGNAGEVWSSIDGPLEVRAYKGPGVVTSGPYFFDGRVGGKLAWRVTAEYACSNGVPFCSVTVPMSSGDPVTAPETVVGPEGSPEYVVFADLAQWIGYRRFHAVEPLTVKADVFDVKAFASLGDDPQVSLPNFLKIAGCSKGNGDYETAAPAKSGEVQRFGGSVPTQPQGPFDGTWRTGEQSCTATEGDGVPVLVAGTKLKMYESDCEIGKTTARKGSTKAAMTCSGEGEEWGMSLELVKKGDRLMIAYDGDKANAYERCPAP
ncbi:hypothetical protein EON79_13130 [bacterium]|nr:MAG: hypothetical protein EON79_13130 [bacterium]